MVIECCLFCFVDGDSRAPRWKKLSSVELGIRSSMISKPTRVVLNALKKKGKGSVGVFSTSCAIYYVGQSK